MITSDIVFPCLGSTIFTLVSYLSKQEDQNLKHATYRNVIQACNGPDDVTEILLSSVCRPVRDLEGKKITVELYVPPYTPKRMYKAHHFLLQKQG